MSLETRRRAAILFLFLATPLFAQMTFAEYEPKSTLVVPEHPQTRAKYPFIDVHNHQSLNMSTADVAKIVADMEIFKNLGMTVTDRSGKRVHTDDPRLDPLWDKAAELGIPVLIHTGEPVAFWSPVDKYNERWLELMQFPERRRTEKKYASFEVTMNEQWNLFRKHPKTTFIAAHLAWLGNDLTHLGKLLDELPNVNTEIGAVLHELGRQPRAARAFLVKYQDRVLMGKDIWNAQEYATYFRVLETEDEYFDYYRKRHAFWKMYGLGLPDPVLKKIYYKNALRLIKAIDPKGFPD